MPNVLTEIANEYDHGANLGFPYSPRLTPRSRSTIICTYVNELAVAASRHISYW